MDYEISAIPASFVKPEVPGADSAKKERGKAFSKEGLSSTTRNCKNKQQVNKRRGHSDALEYRQTFTAEGRAINEFLLIYQKNEI